MVGKRIRQRSARPVVDEIEQILAYGIDRINVADDLFVSHSGKVREVCDEILRRSLRFTWSAFARVNTVDRETLSLMREAGCDSVSFGVESGNPEMLKRIGKGITLEQVREAVSLCRDVRIIAHTSFIAGLPGRQSETLGKPTSSPPASDRFTDTITWHPSGDDDPRWWKSTTWKYSPATGRAAMLTAQSSEHLSLSPAEIERFVKHSEAEIERV
jgi:hypothetical protein